MDYSLILTSLEPVYWPGQLRRRRAQQRARVERQRRFAFSGVLVAVFAATFLLQVLFLTGEAQQVLLPHAQVYVPDRAAGAKMNYALVNRAVANLTVRTAAAAGGDCPIPDSFRPAYERAAASSGVPLALLAAVTTVESRFDPNAHSSAGAIGLMQLMPATAASLGVDPWNADQNVAGGAAYLHSLLVRFGGSRWLALEAYNAGPTIVSQVGGAPSQGTADYAAEVSTIADRLGNCR